MRHIHVATASNPCIILSACFVCRARAVMRAKPQWVLVAMFQVLEDVYKNIVPYLSALITQMVGRGSFKSNYFRDINNGNMLSTLAVLLCSTVRQAALASPAAEALSLTSALCKPTALTYVFAAKLYSL